MKRNQDENINKKQVGRRIMAIRKRKLLTLIDFAKKIEASKSSVSDWEQGFRLPPEAALTKIAIMGNTSVDKLLYGNGNNEVEEIYQRIIKLPEADILGIFRRVHNKFKLGGEWEILVNISDDILELLKLDELEETKDNKQLIENTVNAYILGGMLTASEYGKIDVKEEDILSLLKYYEQKMKLLLIKVMLSKDFKGGFTI